MSVESDARDCLIEAIASDGTVLTPEQLPEAQPDDQYLRYQDDLSWLKVLNRAAKCLRSKGYAVSQAEQSRAENLLSKPLTMSVGYLVQLASAKATRAWLLRGTAVALVTTALTLTVWTATRQRRSARRQGS